MTESKEKSFPYLPMRGISRVDNSKGNYWLVRINWQGRKPGLQKWFMDVTHGGLAKAFMAAVTWRDENIDVSTIKSNGINRLENAHMEQHHTPKDIKDKWKKQRIERRLAAIREHGRTSVKVGTGIAAAKKARKMGASKVTCWKIRSGQQDTYQIWNVMPGVDLNWSDRKTGKSPDIERQKETGKVKTILGTGREAALKAKEMGASQDVCLNIDRGRQDFFYCCATIPHFEANGFKRDIPKEISDKIISLAHHYARHKPQDAATEAMINYASRYEIPNDDNFLKRLVSGYVRIAKLSKLHPIIGKKRTIPLDLNGDIERINDEGDVYGSVLNTDPYYENLRSVEC